MLQNAYFLAKIGADTAENEQHFAEILPTDALRRRTPTSARCRRAPGAPVSRTGISRVVESKRRWRFGTPVRASIRCHRGAIRLMSFPVNAFSYRWHTSAKNQTFRAQFSTHFSKNVKLSYILVIETNQLLVIYSPCEEQRTFGIKIKIPRA